MPACPAGHDSASTDFCDVCGIRLATPAQPGVHPDAQFAAGESGAVDAVRGADAGAGADIGAAGTGGTDADSRREPCPRCGTPRSGQFCEACGFDFASARAADQPAPAPASPAAVPGSATAVPGSPAPSSAPRTTPELTRSAPEPAWTAVVAADRVYYDGVIAAGGPDAAAVQFPGYCPERRFALTGPEMRIGRRSPSRGLEPEIDLTGPPADPGISRLHAVLVAEPGGGWSLVDPGSENGTLVNGTEIAAGARVPVRAGDRIHLGAWTVISISADPHS